MPVNTLRGTPLDPNKERHRQEDADERARLRRLEELADRFWREAGIRIDPRLLSLTEVGDA